MMRIERSYTAGSLRKCLIASVFKSFVILTLLCILYTLCLISITLRNNDIIAVGSYKDQFLIPNDQELEKLSDNQLLDIFTKYINSFQIMCRNHRRIGQLLDGGKEVCVDEVIRPKSPCLVYSFGKWEEENKFVTAVFDGKEVRIPIKKNSNNQFDFEDKVIKHFGCEVFTFDPTMGKIDRKDMKIPTGCRFNEMGLEGEDMPRKNLYKLNTILQKFGHSGKTLDLLKIDIEGSEWSALDEMMTSDTLKNVRQLLVEFHFQGLAKYEKIRNFKVFRKLYDYGFRVFSRERNTGQSKFYKELGYSVAFFVEISFVNIRYL